MSGLFRLVFVSLDWTGDKSDFRFVLCGEVSSIGSF